MSRPITFAAAMAAATVFALPAAARGYEAPTSIFSQCDGYGIPASGGDGMTKYAMVWGIFNPPGWGTTAQTGTQRGAAAVAACSQALNDPALKADQWMRRVSLLRARALHHLENDDFTSALADLDLAEQAAVQPDEPYYARSLGLGLSFVRAYALRRAGETDKAREVALAGWKRRPWSRQSAYSAQIALGGGASEAEELMLGQAAARLQPMDLDDLFRTAFRQSRWGDVTAAYPGLIPPKVRRRYDGYGGVHEYDVQVPARDAVYRATTASLNAYALAALGRGAEARAALQAAKARLAEDTAPPPLPEPPAKPTIKSSSPGADLAQQAYRKALKAHQEKVKEVEALRVSLAKAGEQARPTLEAWGRLVEARVLAEEGKGEAVLADDSVRHLPRGPMSIDLVGAILAKTPKLHPQTRAELEALRTRLVEAQPPVSEIKVQELFDTLPQAETRARVTRYKPAKPNIWTGDESGFSVKALSDERAAQAGAPVMRIGFRGQQAPASIVEEMALLRAADLARQAGKKGLIVLARQDIEHSTVTMT